MAKKTSLLMVEDSLPLAAIYMGYLKDEAVEIRHVSTLTDSIEYLQHTVPDIVLLDIELPDGNGMDLLKEIMNQSLQTDVIVMTAHGSTDMAGQAIRTGAFDFLTKPFDANRLQVTVANAVKHLNLSKKVQTFSALERDRYGRFVGQSLPMQAVYRIIDSVAVSDATAFIVGESGTGKELAAEAVHEKSKRANNTFHAINCGAIPSELMESELFGHVKGAFTGATCSRDGAATIADGGTLFLDEICEMELDLQKKLLRFIQSGEFQPVGSNKIERVDIRFVCATNKDPLTEVREGRFREDLFYRLHVIPLQLPPLRDRDDDILMIARTFLAEISDQENKSFLTFSPEVEKIFMDYEWPGNVRELQNTIQNIVVLNDSEEVAPHMLPMQVLAGNEREVAATSSADQSEQTQTIEPLWVTEKRAIEWAIEQSDGNVNRAAGLLEVAPSTIYRKVQSWNTHG
ncbi:MAG: two-component system repressor protein LuxO [Candidatus Azotimanducaceae bacterium]|jgi:two-component system repressor protein LuxO